MAKKEEVEFEYDWLSCEDCQFKILTLIAVLADNNLAYRGTLTEMCEFLGLATRQSRTNKKLKEAIDLLERSGLIHTIIDGRVYTLTLSRKAEKRSKVIRIQKEWIEICKAYKAEASHSVSWTALLKVWLFLLDKNGEVITSNEVAECLNLSLSAVKNARWILNHEFGGIHFTVQKEKIDEGCFKTIGTLVEDSAFLAGVVSSVENARVKSLENAEKNKQKRKSVKKCPF